MSNTSDPPVPTAPSNTPEQDLGAAGEGTGDAASKDRHHPLIGKVCLVTGASRGIGKGIALQLGQAGAIVYITGKFVGFFNRCYVIAGRNTNSKCYWPRRARNV